MTVTPLNVTVPDEGKETMLTVLTEPEPDSRTVKPERLMVVKVLKKVAEIIRNRSQVSVSLNDAKVVSSGGSVLLSTASSSSQLFLLAMMTQVSVRSDQEISRIVSPAPVWWISASFLAVTVWGREEQLVRPDTRYISGKHPLSDNRELLELVKLHTNKQVLQYNMYQETVETLTYQN